MISAQVDNGGGLPLVKFDHKAGHETCPDENDENSIYAKETGHPCYRADDALWLFPTVNKYIGESGNKAFLDEVIVYANGGEDTVYEHLKRAINFSMERLGAHTMPAGLYADWNDCLRLGKKGESTFVAFQLYYAMSIIKGYALDRGDNSTLLISTRYSLNSARALKLAGTRIDLSEAIERTARSLALRRIQRLQCGSTHSLGQLSQASHLRSRLKLLWKRYTRYSILHLA